MRLILSSMRVFSHCEGRASPMSATAKLAILIVELVLGHCQCQSPESTPR